MAELENLKKAQSLRDIAALLGYQPQALSYVLYKIPKDKRYTKFFIPKKGGGFRIIKAPMMHLKELQARLASLLVACSKEISASKKELRSLSHGFKHEHSIVTNAQVHKRKRYVFNLDLNNFFPSINFGRVRGFFIKNKDFRLHHSVATVIAQIACDENELPQGSPCSPIISNLVGSLLDVRMAKIAKKNRCTYSRYADDITFSSNMKKFPRAVAKQRFGILTKWIVGRELEGTVEKEGFKINASKTRMQYRISRQIVTGLVVNKKVNIKSEYYRTARSMCHSLFRTGQFYRVLDSTLGQQTVISNNYLLFAILKRLWRKVSLGLYNVGFKTRRNEILMARLGTISELDGILSHIHYVKKIHDRRIEQSHNFNVQKNHNTFTLKDKEKRHDKRYAGMQKLYFRFLYYKNFYGLEKPLILCEGKTDYSYLRCALKSLAPSFSKLITMVGGKVEYHIKFFNYSTTTKEILGLSGGVPNLVTFIRHYKENIKRYTCKGKQHPVIILTDNDEEVKKVFGVYKDITGRVIDGSEPFYFVTDNLYILPVPKISEKETIIEHFFEDTVLKTVVGGKTFNPNNENIDISKEYGKHIFAEAVIKKNRASINFANFQKVLNTICEVLKHYAAQDKQPGNTGVTKS